MNNSYRKTSSINNTIGGKKTSTKKKTTSTTGKKTTIKKKTKGGGTFDFLLGVGRIRGQKYEHWLEQRLVLHYNDIKFVNEVRKKFGYNVTSIGPDKFTKNALCNRNKQNRTLIAPKVKCGKD